MRNREETFFRCLLDNSFTYHIVEGAYKWDPTYDSETRMTIYEIRKKSESIEEATAAESNSSVESARQAS